MGNPSRREQAARDTDEMSHGQNGANLSIHKKAGRGIIQSGRFSLAGSVFGRYSLAGSVFGKKGIFQSYVGKHP
jgi:hypothetical protein